MILKNGNCWDYHEKFLMNLCKWKKKLKDFVAGLQRIELLRVASVIKCNFRVYSIILAVFEIKFLDKIVSCTEQSQNADKN